MSDCRVPMTSYKRQKSLLSTASTQNIEGAAASILDPTEQVIIDAVQSGQNVEAVIKRENAKRDAFGRMMERRYFELGA